MQAKLQLTNIDESWSVTSYCEAAKCNRKPLNILLTLGWWTDVGMIKFEQDTEHSIVLVLI